MTPEGEDDPLLGPLAPSFEAFQWHSYEFPLPPGAVPLARSEVCLQAAASASAPGRSSSTPRSAAPTPSTGSTTTRPTPTRSESGSTPRCWDRRPRKRSTPSTSSAATSAAAGCRVQGRGTQERRSPPRKKLPSTNLAPMPVTRRRFTQRAEKTPLRNRSPREVIDPVAAGDLRDLEPDEPQFVRTGLASLHQHGEDDRLRGGNLEITGDRDGLDTIVEPVVVRGQFTLRFYRRLFRKVDVEDHLAAADQCVFAPLLNGWALDCSLPSKRVRPSSSRQRADPPLISNSCRGDGGAPSELLNRIAV